MEPLLGSALLDEGQNPEILCAPYNQLFQLCFDYRATLEISEGANIDALVVLWRIEDLAQDDVWLWLGGDATSLERILRVVDDLIAALTTLKQSFSGTLIIGSAPPPLELALAAGGPRAHQVNLLHMHCLSRLFAGIERLDGVKLLDIDALSRTLGAGSTFDSRKWYLYRQPFTEAFLALIAGEIARQLRSIRMPPRKCIVLDCDNTLWGGVIGEDGLGGIALGDEFPGRAYRDFQLLLKSLCQSGAMLALCSKNNESDVWEVFDRHDAMILSRSDIAAWSIGWQPKSEGIGQIARELNIAVDSMVFIDDSPHEISEVEQAWPDVACVTMPEDAADILEQMLALPFFDVAFITEEDRKRTGMMLAEKARESVRSSKSPKEFLETLGLSVEFIRVGDEHCGRVAQLVNKTNQFNLTARRRTEAEIFSLLNQDDWRIAAIKVNDRFGEYGMTGVAILNRIGETHWFLDTFLLSCRVLGRCVETAFLSSLRDMLHLQGAKVLTARFVPTAKNNPARDFLPTHGFDLVSNDDGGHDYVVSLEDIQSAPDFISVK
ncbi:MAG: HAD-IIIC family phosphatase [Alphaproteobacteria bacterium]|nr:HAD-IIIC family phosphatase [Alphaproteobacteria bacterium]